MTKKNKKNKTKKVQKGISLEKIPYTITKFYKEYKKEKEIEHLKKIKLKERGETKRIIQENKKLGLREDNIEKEKDRLKLIEEEVKQKDKELKLKDEEQRNKDNDLRLKDADLRRKDFDLIRKDKELVLISEEQKRKDVDLKVREEEQRQKYKKENRKKYKELKLKKQEEQKQKNQEEIRIKEWEAKFNQQVKLEKEQEMGLSTLNPFREFERRVFEHRNNLRKLVSSLVSDGKKVFGYGASTKGNVILQFCGFSSKQIPFIVEVNEDKFGHYTPGTNIPIISEIEANKMCPDYYLVLPWHFRNSILEREIDFINKGGKFIFPLPSIEII